MESPKYRIVRATVADRGRLLAFMRQHFFRHEPLMASLGLLEGPSCTDRIFSLASLHEGTSLMAFDVDDTDQKEILGICLNGETSKHSEGEQAEDLISICPCPKYAKILRFLCELEKVGYVWKYTKAVKVLDVHALAVDTSKRRGGLGLALLDHTVRLAKEQGYPAVSFQCTSQYSALILEKMGASRVFQMRYDGYLDEDGYPVFTPRPPHVALKCYLIVLDQHTGHGA